MKLTLLPAVAFYLISLLSFSQNLVPNWSFETYTVCPTAGDQIHYASGWEKFSISVSTPDYYNACAPAGNYGVPDNIISYQMDRRGCNAYAGIVTKGGSANDREYIGIQLNQPLIIGQKYFISFYTVMGGEKPFNGDYYGMPSNNIGIRLSTVAYNVTDPCPIDNWNHINYPAVLNDSINWKLVSGNIIADSAYHYLIVGNFFNDQSTTTYPYPCSNCFNEYSYYLIDDVCISTDSLSCNGGFDTLPCITATDEVSFVEKINVFPNPTFDIITVSFKHKENLNIVLYDIFGKTVHHQTVNHESQGSIELALPHIGCYWMRITNGNNSLNIIYKIIKL